MRFAGALTMLSLAASPADAPGIVPPQYEAHLIELDRAAIDDAYQRQVRSLFLTWMKDETGQPARAEHGVERARRAYVRSMSAIDRRAEQLKRRP